MNANFKPFVALSLLAMMTLPSVSTQAEESIMSKPASSVDLKALMTSKQAEQPTQATETNPGLTRLDRFVDDLQTFEAGFRQVVFDANKEMVEQSSGYVMIQPPGRFRWEYLDPYPQLILSDGKELWMYDQDLEQVTIQPVDDKLASSPALVLTNRDDLEKNFQLIDLGKRDGHYWVEMQPREQGEFERIWLAFSTDPVDQASLSGMELHDSFGQSTQLWFVGNKRNEGLRSTVFRFVIPEGVDVIRNNGDAAEAEPEPVPAMPPLNMDL